MSNPSVYPAYSAEPTEFAKSVDNAVHWLWYHLKAFGQIRTLWWHNGELTLNFHRFKKQSMEFVLHPSHLIRHKHPYIEIRKAIADVERTHVEDNPMSDYLHVHKTVTDTPEYWQAVKNQFNDAQMTAQHLKLAKKLAHAKSTARTLSAALQADDPYADSSQADIKQ